VDPDQSSPTRLFATLSGAVLVIGGTVGFFASSSFGTPGDIEDSLGAFAVNGWLNTLHIVIGGLGLLAAGFAARSYSLAAGLLLAALAIWGFALGDGEAILDRVPADGAENFLHAVLAALGLAAAWADRPPRRKRKKRERPRRDEKRGKKREDMRPKKREEKKSEGKREKKGAGARSGSADRSPPREAGRDSASPGDEPPEPPARRSRRRPRPPRPRA
jgi:hypothetical protein